MKDKDQSFSTYSAAIREPKNTANNYDKNKALTFQYLPNMFPILVWEFQIRRLTPFSLYQTNCRQLLPHRASRWFEICQQISKINTFHKT